MDRVDSDKQKNLDVKVWKEYESILGATQDQKTEITYLERFQFYERAKKAYGNQLKKFIYHREVEIIYIIKILKSLIQLSIQEFDFL